MNNFQYTDILAGSIIFSLLIFLVILILLFSSFASVYFIAKLCKKVKENKKYIIPIIVSFIVLLMSVFQLYSFYSMYVGYNFFNKNKIQNVEDEVIVHFLNAAKFSPFVGFKTFAYEQAEFIYETYNTKEKFNHEKHLKYKILASKYKKENMKSVLLSAVDYGYYEVARRAALETKEYYWAALACTLMEDYQNAIMYSDIYLKMLSKNNTNKRKNPYDIYLLRGVVYKNLNNKKLADENFNKARENCKKDACKKRIEKAYKNYKKFYQNEISDRYKTSHIDVFGY